MAKGHEGETTNGHESLLGAVQLTEAIARAPMRALAYSEPDGQTQVAYNAFDVVLGRRRLAESQAGEKYDAILREVTKAVGVPVRATALPVRDDDDLIVNDAVGSVPELGLDQFCQKVVAGVHTAHNDIEW
ncbi:MAG: hypothetical protein P8R42_07560 [Candidatus Binatia bacterium]|nr:hypothetical protein [Candidatus Binatia bacterium]